MRTVAATGAAVILAPAPYVTPAGGTATCAAEWPEDVEGAAAGEVTSENGLVNAHFSRVRQNGVKVYLGGALVPELVGGVKVTRTLDSPVAMAEFVVAHPRVAHFHPTSLAAGPETCEIRFLTGPPGSIEEHVVFTGEAETASNDGPYRPVATFRATDPVASRWAKDRGCVREMPFSGQTRGALLVQLAAQLRIPLANATDIALRGGVVNKPVDFAGTILEFVNVFCEPEGWILVERDGLLELLEDDHLLDGEPIIELDEDTLFACPEQGPDQPGTRFALSGTRLVEAALAGVGTETKTEDSPVAADGSFTRTSVTSKGGVELLRRTEYHEYFAPDGDPVGIAAVRCRRAEEVENDWIITSRTRPSGAPAISTQLAGRITRLYETTGIRAALDYGSGHDWVEAGERFTTPEASLILESEQRETFEWNDDTDPSIPAWKACTLVRHQADIYGYYSRMVDPAGVGAHEYADGSFRENATYSWRQIARTVQEWDDARAATPGWVGWVTMRETQKRFRSTVRAAAPNSNFWVDSANFDTEAIVIVRTWRPNESNSEYRLDEVTYQRDPSVPGPRVTPRSETFSGPCPGAPVGSANVPQIIQQPMLWSYDYADEVGYPSVPVTETNPHAENELELAACGRRKMRRALEVTYRCEARDYPGLREGDVLAIVDRSRSLSTARKGYIRSIEILRDFGGLARCYPVVAVRTWGA